MSVGEGRRPSQARMVGSKEKFLRDAGARGLAGPESAKITAQPQDRPDRRVAAKERSERAFGVERNGRLERVQALGPAAERGGAGQAIRVFDRRRRLFPRAMLLKAPPQGLATSQQAIVRVRQRKRREEKIGRA